MESEEGVLQRTPSVIVLGGVGDWGNRGELGNRGD